MLNALVIVWRESLEAMLVIGVLLSWIARQPGARQSSLKRGVWGGTGVGLGLALALGYATYAIQSEWEARSEPRRPLRHGALRRRLDPANGALDAQPRPAYET